MPDGRRASKRTTDDSNGAGPSAKRRKTADSRTVHNDAVAARIMILADVATSQDTTVSSSSSTASSPAVAPQVSHSSVPAAAPLEDVIRTALNRVTLALSDAREEIEKAGLAKNPEEVAAAAVNVTSTTMLGGNAPSVGKTYSSDGTEYSLTTPDLLMLVALTPNVGSHFLQQMTKTFGTRPAQPQPSSLATPQLQYSDVTRSVGSTMSNGDIAPNYTGQLPKSYSSTGPYVPPMVTPSTGIAVRGEYSPPSPVEWLSGQYSQQSESGSWVNSLASITGEISDLVLKIPNADNEMCMLFLKDCTQIAQECNKLEPDLGLSDYAANTFRTAATYAKVMDSNPHTYNKMQALMNSIGIQTTEQIQQAANGNRPPILTRALSEVRASPPAIVSVGMSSTPLGLTTGILHQARAQSQSATPGRPASLAMLLGRGNSLALQTILGNVPPSSSSSSSRTQGPGGRY